MSMPVRRVVGLIATVLCFVSLGADSARGQMDLLPGAVPPPEWQYVGSLGDAHHPVPLYSYTATYFFGPVNGIAAISYKGVPIIYWLASNIQTMGLWKSASIPAGISYIRQFRFIQGKLYAASKGTDVLISSDSGKTWKYAGLGLIDANDVYADASGTIRALHDPMKVFARLDTMHCIAQGDANIFVSSDGGLNWVSSGVPMFDSISAGAFADRCQNVYVCPNSYGTAFRSTDLGQTWRTVGTGSGQYPEFLNGASTTVYITDTLGMFRSTDDGLTWNSVITIDSGACLPMFVFGPMGEHVVIACVIHVFNVGDYDVLLLTATGGMDDLHGAPSATDSNGAPLAQQDTMNVPLELSSSCKPYLIPITFESDVDSMTTRISITNDSLGDFFFQPTGTIPLRMHHEDTLWMQYDPHHPVANVVLSFENHWHCSDWTETRTVHVDAIPKALIDLREFAAGCVPDTEAGVILLDSCQTLCIDSIYIPSSSPGLRLLTPLPDTASIGVRDSLLFAFSSSGISETASDSVTIYGHYLGLDSLLDDYFYFPHAWGVDTNFAFFYTTVPVTLKSLPFTNTLAAKDSTIDIGPTLLCEIRDTFAVIRNVGCDSVCVSNVVLKGTGFRIIAGADSSCLAPSERDTVWLVSQVDTSGHPMANTDSLIVTSDAKPPLAPIVLSHEISYPPSWELVLSPPDSADAGANITYQIVQHGTLPAGVTSVDFQVVFDDDLLKLNSVDETWVGPPGYYRSSDGMAHYLLHISPVPQDSVVATLHLEAYLAKTISTALELDSIALNGIQQPQDCIASVSVAQSAFTIISQCATPVLTSFLRSGTVTISTIDPNPATNDATISIYSNAQATITGELSLVNGIGREMQSEHITISPGSNQVPVNLISLPSGMYALRLRTEGLPAIKSFVKE